MVPKVQSLLHTMHYKACKHYILETHTDATVCNDSTVLSKPAGNILAAWFLRNSFRPFSSCFGKKYSLVKSCYYLNDYWQPIIEWLLKCTSKAADALHGPTS